MDLSQLSPVMQHYMETRKECPDCILFYRPGDFYGMFFDDTLTMSKELEITLTGKDCGLSERVPVCGVPFHAADSYLYRLAQKGYKITITEQMEDPKRARGLMKREIIRVVTPGTITSSQVLDETKSDYLMGIVYIDRICGIPTADINTRNSMIIEVDLDRESFDEINKFSPSEVICNSAFYMSGTDTDGLKNRYQMVISSPNSRSFDEESRRCILMEHFKMGALVGLGLEDYATGIIAADAVMWYIYETQKSTSEHVTTVTPYSTGQCMVIDTSTRRDLELVEIMHEKQERGALLWVLDKTKTAMGARLLRACTEQPLIHRNEIIGRQNTVEELNMSYISREEICEYLNPTYDLERLIGCISYKTANLRGLITFRSSLEVLPYIKRILGELSNELLAELGRGPDLLQDILRLIGDAIVREPPITVREGDIIKDGYNQETGKLHQTKTGGKSWLAELEARGKEKTGVKTLKVKFSKVFGYCFEVTSSSKDQVSNYRIHKQTLTNARRFTTDELEQLEDIIMDAEERLVSLEYGLFCEVGDKIGAEVVHTRKTAKSIAGIDVFCSLSVVTTHCNYVKPSINDKGAVQIKNGHHPVVEQTMRDDMSVTNDIFLDNGRNRLSVITGPNIAGKSTYMCQVALIVLMAQLGSFVSAQETDIGICDRVFTRVGAPDDLTSGQSTFMVEMTEVASILRNATRNSLLVLGEIGRETSTFDGLSVVQAVIEHISNSKPLGAETLFATHYHKLTELEDTMAGVKNCCIAVKEQGNDIVFLRKIIRDGTNRNCGIQVTKLTGVPDSVIARTKEIAEELDDAGITAKVERIAEVSFSITQYKAVPKPGEVGVQQLSFSDTVKDDDIIRELDSLELSTATPLDAVNTLYHLQIKLENRWGRTE